MACRVRCEDLIGASECMQQLFELIERVATFDSPVLLRGETGTGERTGGQGYSRYQRTEGRSLYSDKLWSFTETLLESELFGYETGAFTGARKAKKGRWKWRRANPFLDEIGEIPLKMQIDLLRVLQEKCFHRVGGTEVIPIDFRLICATNRDLIKEIERGPFARISITG